MEKQEKKKCYLFQKFIQNDNYLIEFSTEIDLVRVDNLQ